MQPPPTARTIAERLATVRAEIAAVCARSGRKADEVAVLAVTKGWPPQTVQQAHEAGLRHFGENYVQELCEKSAAVAELGIADACWHFIGTLQSNKARDVVGQVEMVHSLASMSAARQLSQHSGARPVPVCVEVNLAGEEQKSGLAPAALEPFLRDVAALPGLALRGLMTVPPFSDEPHASRPYFEQLAALLPQLRARLNLGADFNQLSMGMSADYGDAIACGATWVRIGTTLFGERPGRRWSRTTDENSSTGGSHEVDTH
jgi:PLP dependent protein